MAAHDTGASWRAPVHLGVALLLCTVAAVLRAGPLGPSSLWLDDAWVALVSKTSGVADTFMVGLTGPGFAFLLKGWLAIVGFSEMAAQLPAFAFGVVAPGLLYLVAVARGFPPAAAVLAGALLAASPVHIVYATRVKHYTLDSLLAVALIGLAWALVQQPSRRRWAWLVVAACVAVAMSAGLAPVAVAALGGGALASVQGGRRRVVEAGVACAIWLAFALGWYAVVLRPAITPALRGYWDDRYLDAPGDLWSGLAGVADGFSALPAVVTWGLVAAGVLVLALVARRRWPVTVLFLGPVIMMIVMAALNLAPLGGGRTDAVLYPGLALAAGGSLAWANRRAESLRLALAAALAAGGMVMSDTAPPYPPEDVRPLVAELERRRDAGEPLIVYPSTIWAYALYTSAPVTVQRSATTPWGFRPQVDDAAVILLAAARDSPRRYVPPVAAAAREADGRLWLLVSHERPDAGVIEATLRDQGLRRHDRIRRPGAHLQQWR